MKLPIHETVLFVLVGIAAGFLLARDYGLSWDEYFNETYAQDTVEMYLGERAPGDTIIDKEYYGPAFLVPWLLARNTLLRLFPAMGRVDGGHLVYWLAYLPAPLIFYGLCRRFSGRLAAAGATLLFATQPAIFGHAFVNPKDPPFMTAMLAAIWTGLLAVDLNARPDRWPTLDAIPGEGRRLAQAFRVLWQGSSRGKRALVLIIWVALILMAFDLFITQGMLQGLLATIHRAYEGQAMGPAQSLFNVIAQDAFKTPFSAYADKARAAHSWLRYPLSIVGFLLVVYLSIRLLGARISWRWFSARRTWWAWLAAAVVLGFCSAIRVLGPFAALLVSLYAFRRLRRKAWLPLFVYGAISILVLVAAWPSLWESPFHALSESLFRMSRFPWKGRVLYDGIYYAVDQLPWHYVPRSVALELTIPALVASVAGFGFVLVDAARHRRVPVLTALVLLWIGLPLAAVMWGEVQIYSAFRHMMFVLPALFLLAAMGLEGILAFLPRPLWRLLLIAIAVAPGVIAIFRLHPYEMVYYNELAGGVSGAAGRFARDAWGTPYRKAIEYVSEVAPEGARVLVDQNAFHTMTPFLRQDLMLARLTASGISAALPGAYIVTTSNLRGQAETEAVYVVERDGYILAEVRVVR